MTLSKQELNQLKKTFQDALMIINEIEVREKGSVNHEQIISKVCQEMGVKFSELRTSDRHRFYALRRQMLMTVLLEKTNLGLTVIGKMFNRDHTTVIHSRKTVYNLSFSDPEVRELFNRVRVASEEQILKIA